MKRLGVPSSFRGRRFQASQIAATFSALTLPSAPRAFVSTSIPR